MLLTRAELNIRPTHCKGESLAGYVYRLYGENGHRLPIEVITLLGILYRGRHESFLVDAFNEIQRIVGAEHQLNYERWVERRRGVGMSSKWDKWALAADIEFKFCPSCLQSFGYHLGIWELKFVSVCPVHLCRLIRFCPGCKRQFAWKTLEAGWICQCGQSLCKLTPAVVPRQFAALSIYVCRSWDLDLPAEYPLVQSRDPASLSLAYRTIYQLGLWRGLIFSIYRDGSNDLAVAHQYTRERINKSSLFVGRQLHYEGFIKTLRKLIHMRWRDSSSMLIYISGDSREMSIVRFLVSIGHDIPQRAYLDSCIGYFFSNYSFPIGFAGLIIFNPAYEWVDRRNKVARFVKWCKRQFGNSLAVSYHQAALLGNSCSNTGRESRAIGIVNGLLELSLLKVRCNRKLRTLVSTCLFPNGVVLGETGLLREIALRFMRLPDSQAEQLQTLLCQHLARAGSRTGEA